MAKEVVIKIKVDGQEIDVAKKSTKELTDQISELKTKLESVPVGSKDFKKIQGDIDNLEKGFIKAKQSTQGFVQNLSELPGIAGLAGKSLQGIKQGFDLLLANPIVAVFALLASVLLKVIDKMKNLEGVMDPLEKIGKAVSGVFDVLANVILPPVAAALELIAEGAVKVANFFGNLVGASSSVGDSMEYVADTMDRLNDTNAEFELNQAKANRALQEAREIAGDSTKTIGERVNALKNAEKIERDIAAKARARELDKAHAQAVELANSLGYSDKQIAAIKRYDAAQLESYLKEISLKKGLNREKSDALFASLAKIEESAAQEAKIGKKTASQITSLQREEASKQEEIRKRAAEQTKDYLTRLATFQNDTRLNNIKDEQEKARVSLEIDKKKTLDEIAGLEMSTKRKTALKVAALEDFASKEKVLLAKQKEDNDKKNKEDEEKARAFAFKIEELDIATYEKELERQKASIDAKAYQDKVALSNDLQFKKYSAEEQARILGLVDKKARMDKAKLDEDEKKKNYEKRLKDLDDELKFLQIKGEAIIKGTSEYFDNLRAITDASEKRELAAQELTESQKTDIKKKYAKQRTDIDKQELDSYLGFAVSILGAVNQVYSNINEINQMQMEQDLKNAKGNAEEEDKIKRKYFEKNKKTQIAQAIIGTLQAAIQAYQSLAVIPVVGVGLGIAAAAAALIFGYKKVDLIKQQQYDSGATPAGTGAGTIPVEARPQGYADGGMIGGKRHAQGGTLIEAEQGEAIMSRGSVTMFGPLLSQLNQMGGGTPFGNTMVRANDNPKSGFPSDYTQQPVQIIKTYVVEGELTSQQQKQARLKDLSTI
jgi:rRNA processing protein Gar1